jgi:hypothetical protein
MIYLGQRREVSLCDKFWMTPLHTEVSEESRTNKKQIFFETCLLLFNNGINYNFLNTKRTASVIMQRYHFIRQPSLFTSRWLDSPTEFRRTVKNDF